MGNEDGNQDARWMQDAGKGIVKRRFTPQMLMHGVLVLWLTKQQLEPRSREEPALWPKSGVQQNHSSLKHTYAWLVCIHTRLRRSHRTRSKLGSLLHTYGVLFVAIAQAALEGTGQYKDTPGDTGNSVFARVSRSPFCLLSVD